MITPVTASERIKHAYDDLSDQLSFGRRSSRNEATYSPHYKEEFQEALLEAMRALDLQTAKEASISVSGGITYFRCPNCNLRLKSKRMQFCSECGQAVTITNLK